MKAKIYPVLSFSLCAPDAQAAGGHGPERKQRIDWMYEGPMQTTQDREAESNEYLMGKEVRPARLLVLEVVGVDSGLVPAPAVG